MREIACNRRESAADCEEPGDFAWRVCSERDTDGDACGWRNPKEGERPTHLYLVNPEGARAFLAIRPEKQANGASWEWNGDLDRPSLKPSINDPGGWHGWLGNGVLTDA